MRNSTSFGRLFVQGATAIGGSGVGDAIRRETRKILRNHHFMFLLAVIFFNVAGIVYNASYYDTPLSRHQIAEILLTQPQEIRTRTLKNLRADYGVMASGDPITRGLLRSTIREAKSDVEYDRLRADIEKTDAANRSTLDAVSHSVNHAQ